MFRSCPPGTMYGGMGYGNGGPLHKRKDERKVAVTFGRGDGTEHCNGMQSLLLHGDNLFTASRDSTVKRMPVLWAQAAVLHRWHVPEGHVPRYEATFDAHTDWVNDVVMVDQFLATGSSDRTVKLWNPTSAGGNMCISQRQHLDYVSSLASNSARGLLASAGLRAQVFVWNLKESAEMRECLKLFPHDENKEKGSIYTIDMAQQADLLAAGSTDAVVRIFDMRQGKKIMKLKGHTDNVRCVVLNPEGTRLLSGSSDHTIKVWDLGHQRCIQTLHCHTDSVWSLVVMEGFNTVLSGGRDKCVYRTSISHRTSELLFVEDHPIQKMVATANGSSLWVATASSSTKKWSIPGKVSIESSLWSSMDGARAVPGRPFLVSTNSRRSSEVVKVLEPLQSTPAEVIKGMPPIVDQVVLTDRRHVLAKDQEDNVTMWDVSTGHMVKAFGKADFKATEASLFQPVSIPRWFSCDNRLGMLTITLQYPQCHHAEIYSTDLGVEAPPDQRVNFGDCMLRGLFGNWAMQKNMENDFAIPDDMLEGSDVWGKGWVDHEGRKVTCFRFWEMKPPGVWVSSTNNQGDPWCLKIESISGKLQDVEDLPEWVGDCVLRLRSPTLKEWKCSFLLISEDPSQVPSLAPTRLNAPKILQVRKVAKYLIDKLKELDPPFKARIPPVDWEDCTDARDEEEDSMDDDYHELELLCENKAIPFSMSIGAVQDYIAKGASEVGITYRLRTKSTQLPVIPTRTS